MHIDHAEVRAETRRLAGFPGFIASLTAFSCALALPASAQDGYRTLPVSRLAFDDGELALPLLSNAVDVWTARLHVWVEGEGEAFVAASADSRLGAYHTLPVGELELCVRSPANGTVRGVLVVPGPGTASSTADKTGATRLPFSIEMGPPGDAERSAFVRAELLYYESLRSEGLPGGAWFRHRADAARGELAARGAALPLPGRARASAAARPGALDDAYGLLSGGRALAENLQLDRVLAPRDGTQWIPIEEVEGLTTRRHDWETSMIGIEPRLDSLARLVPFDQHAAFFPSFGAFVRVLDEVRANGAPVLELFETSSEDARTRERYERQLCLELGLAARVLGDSVVTSVALTGGDPYLRTGSDVALLFETRTPGPFVEYLRSRHRRAEAELGAVRVHATVRGRQLAGVRTPDRSVHSLYFVEGDTVVVGNSLAQLERIARVAETKWEAMSRLHEYRFFRQRYPLGADEETCFLVVSDATIRRWCGPRWRIGAARRTRAAAVLADETARLLEDRSRGSEPRAGPELARADLGVPGGGPVWRGPDGVWSEGYGTPAFLTPVSELAVERVTLAERDAYDRFRRGYESNWQQFFDPIAARFTVEEDRLGVDLTVMPLIAGTDHRDLIELTGNAQIVPGAGDPHEEAILHVVMALDRDSQPVRRFAWLLENVLDEDFVTRMSWLGESCALYIDSDPFLREAAASEDPGGFLWDEFESRVGPVDRQVVDHGLPWLVLAFLGRIPVAVHVESRNPPRLAAFLDALRGSMTRIELGSVWETREHEGHSYAAWLSDSGRGPDGYHAALPDGLVASPREDVLLRALERRSGARPDAPAPWLGESVAVHVHAEFIELVLALWGESHHDELQRLSWRALPILNEWRRLFPGEDPLALHERSFGVRLLDPGGGDYVWNEAWQTYASTSYGHPGVPLRGPRHPRALLAVRGADMGLTFEDEGLRARAVVWR